jgi:trehalose 6-phosphate phosphatase
MKYFFSAWETVKYQIGVKALMLLFDFDGTLAPIVSRPEKACLPQETLDLLKVLSQKISCQIAIVSGRELSDVKHKIGIESLVYVGNHGLEIEGPGIQHTVTISDTYLQTLQIVKTELQATIGGYKGAFVEDKGLTLSVHFRLVELEKIIELRNKARAVLLPYSMKDMIKVRSGKMVFEIRPPVLWDKGKATLWLIDKWRAMFEDDSAISLYCGDDATDEDAFRILEGKGITIVVGAHDDSAAQYYLNTQGEVNNLLKNIIELKK